MYYTNEIVVIFVCEDGENRVIHRFTMNKIYQNRSEAIIAGQDFVKDYQRGRPDCIKAFFRTIYA